jgi:hypothetical protein
MAVEDSNPERRNLLVTSLGFVAYYYGHGAFVDKELQLELINIHFHKTGFLAALAWTMLFWFLFRYWQTTRGKFTTAFAAEVDRNCNIALMREFIERHYIRESGDTRTGCLPASISWHDRPNGVRAVQFVPRAGGGPIEGKLPLVGIDGLIALWAVRLRCVFMEPSFFSYITPYILAAAAVAGPLFK